MQAALIPTLEQSHWSCDGQLYSVASPEVFTTTSTSTVVVHTVGGPKLTSTVGLLLVPAENASIKRRGWNSTFTLSRAAAVHKFCQFTVLLLLFC